MTTRLESAYDSNHAIHLTYYKTGGTILFQVW